MRPLESEPVHPRRRAWHCPGLEVEERADGHAEARSGRVQMPVEPALLQRHAQPNQQEAGSGRADVARDVVDPILGEVAVALADDVEPRDQAPEAD